MIDRSTYVTVYDANVAPLYDATGLAMGLVLVAICSVLALAGWLRWRRGNREFATIRMLAIGGGGGALVLASSLGMTLASWSSQSRLRAALHDGRYVQVEGTVADFTAGDEGGHTDESWTVSSGGARYRYQYNRSSIIPGFHESAGPVHGAARVRIADVHGRIARLEVAAPSSAADREADRQARR